MNPTTTFNLWNELSDIYEGRALNPYGLSQINQRAHAIQSAFHARAMGLTDALVTAALLHDIGHMVHGLGEHPAAQGIDDHHEIIGTKWLMQHFDAAVYEPVRLHVAAKRYLCAVDSTYHHKLSRDSIESLALQGGPMNTMDIAQFEREPYCHDAVTLRKIDEIAKDPHAPEYAFEEFRDAVTRAAQAVMPH